MTRENITLPMVYLGELPLRLASHIEDEPFRSSQDGTGDRQQPPGGSGPLTQEYSRPRHSRILS